MAVLGTVQQQEKEERNLEERLQLLERDLNSLDPTLQVSEGVSLIQTINDVLLSNGAVTFQQLEKAVEFFESDATLQQYLQKVFRK